MIGVWEFRMVDYFCFGEWWLRKVFGGGDVKIEV